MNAQELMNTPGYYYAIAYTLSSIVIIYTHEHKIAKWKIIVSNVVQFVLLMWFMQWTHGVSKTLFIPAIAVIVAILLIHIYYCCRFSWRETGFYCVKAFINGEFASSFCWQISYYLCEKNEKYVPVRQALEMLIVYAVIFVVLFFIERSLQKDLEELHITRRELLVVIVIAAAVFAVSNLSYLDQNGLFSGRLVMDIFIIRTLVDLSGMAVLYAYHIQVKEVQLRFEKNTLHNIMDMQYQNYQLSKESMDMVNQKYHDLKHQITLLKAEADSGKSVQYLEKMEQEIKVYETQNKTGNQVLDAVLTNKALLCQKEGIELKFMIDGALLAFMEDMDISALFGNMLDNAIESVCRQKNQEKRLIGLYVTREKQFLRIRTENYCEEKLEFRNGLPVTTKADKHLHGYGMKSIRTIVEKYGGSAVASQKNNWFELKILIPVTERGN